MRMKGITNQAVIDQIDMINKSVNQTSLETNKYYQFYDENDAKEFEEFLKSKSKKLGE